MTDTISVAQLPRPDFTSLEVGTVIEERAVTLTRDTLVRYAGASGDFNPIHYRDDVAEAVGLPGVLAHGMLTMGVALQPVVDALGDPGRVLDYQVRFTRPVVVDPQAGAEVSVSTRTATPSPASRRTSRPRAPSCSPTTHPWCSASSCARSRSRPA